MILQQEIETIQSQISNFFSTPFELGLLVELLIEHPADVLAA